MFGTDTNDRPRDGDERRWPRHNDEPPHRSGRRFRRGICIGIDGRSARYLIERLNRRLEELGVSACPIPSPDIVRVCCGNARAVHGGSVPKPKKCAERPTRPDQFGHSGIEEVGRRRCSSNNATASSNRPFAHLGIEFELRLRAMQQAGEIPDPATRRSCDSRPTTAHSANGSSRPAARSTNSPTSGSVRSPESPPSTTKSSDSAPQHSRTRP